MSEIHHTKQIAIFASGSGSNAENIYDYFQDSNIVWIDNNEKQVLNDYLYRFYEICNWQSTKGKCHCAQIFIKKAKATLEASV